MNDTSYGSTLDTNQSEQSLVGAPAAANDSSSQVGMPAPTQEELDREIQRHEHMAAEDRERIFAALLEKKELGLYAEKDLMEENGKKILVDKGTGQLGIDSETGTQMVRNSSGSWLSPSDPDYDKTLSNVAPQLATADQQEKGKQAEDQKTSQREEDVRAIQTMTAIDEGSGQSKEHLALDEAALQRLRQGASNMEVKNLKNIVAAVDGFISIEATDINPEMHHLQPTAVSGPGVDLAMEEVRKRKERENAQFAEANMRRKEKDNKA